MKRFSFAVPLVLVLTLLPSAAQAQEKCGPLQVLNTIQMTREANGIRDLIPVAINGVTSNFIFDTGASSSLMTLITADEAKLKMIKGNIVTVGLAGDRSIAVAKVPRLELGRMQDKDTSMPVNNRYQSFGGFLGLDYIAGFDADMDFGTDIFQMISPDHCRGNVVYWKTEQVAQVPIAMIYGHVRFPVMLDGHEVQAILDTGASNTTLRLDIAKGIYGLTPGSADTPEAGPLNGNARLKTYNHIFKSLSFAGISVTNPRLTVIPGRIGTQNDPEMILGMNVLRKLHLYVAFKEKMMYVSAASVPAADYKIPRMAALSPEEIVDLRKRFTLANLHYADQQASIGMSNVSSLINRCMLRANLGIAEEETVSLCDRALTAIGSASPNWPPIMYERSLVQYLRKHYQEALDGFTAYIALNRKDGSQAGALLFRGYAKGRLGDTAGMATDIAAAKAIDPKIEDVRPDPLSENGDPLPPT